eukprot:754167-Hanusia_phi.AAC.2
MSAYPTSQLCHSPPSSVCAHARIDTVRRRSGAREVGVLRESRGGGRREVEERKEEGGGSEEESREEEGGK